MALLVTPSWAIILGYWLCILDRVLSNIEQLPFKTPGRCFSFPHCYRRQLMYVHCDCEKNILCWTLSCLQLCNKFKLLKPVKTDFKYTFPLPVVVVFMVEYTFNLESSQNCNLRIVQIYKRDIGTVKICFSSYLPHTHFRDVIETHHQVLQSLLDIKWACPISGPMPYTQNPKLAPTPVLSDLQAPPPLNERLLHLSLMM